MTPSLGDRLRAVLLGSGRAWPLVFLLAGVGLGVGRYSDLVWGNAAVNPDMRRMFRPIAEGVAAGGQLYGPGLADNKPPGWQLVNVAAELTGEYTLAMLVVVGLANGLAAALLYRWLDRAGPRFVAVAAATLFLLALPLLGGNTVNSRPLAVPFLLVALAAARPALRGAAVAVAALVNAYAGTFVLLLLWLVWRDSPQPRRDAVTYLAGGAAVAALAFGAVAAGWGVDAMLAALHWSYGVPLADGVATSAVHPAAVAPGSYLTATWLLTEPATWAGYVTGVVWQLFPLLALAALGVFARDRLPWPPVLAGVLGLALAAGLVPFLVRAYEQYWQLVLPFLAAFAAGGLAVLLDAE